MAKQKKTGLLVFTILMLSNSAFSQETDSTKSTSYISGSVSVTNNGISIVPSFSLGKPAIMFNLSAGKNRFSFDPDLRFSWSGKPWSFIFWGRYKLVTNEKLTMSVGSHLGLNFITSVIPINGDTSEVTIERRYLAGELSPKYLLTKNIGIGIYYLYAHGLDAGTIKNSNFINLNANFSNIRLTNQFFMYLTPAFYYLKLDQEDGFYFTASATLARKNLPISISVIINKTIQSDITNNKNFLWNISLAYSFYKKFVKI